ncbi:toxin-antitoxin system YwqK family antitoxin [Aquimarina rubra]|uniref:Toxin-antitoxin system YwqK family antitoxin n=1 Tax=Aquimarina rubra TaxID=1920033 RepID=A0ABW5LLD9_9FLAO
MKNILFKPLSLVSLIFFSIGSSQELALLTNKTKDSTPVVKKIDNTNQNTFYYSDGTIKEIRETVNNKLEGSWKYFHSNGQLKKEGTFKNNKAEGIWRVYNKNGTLVFVENYKNGIEQGIWKAFDPDGKIKIEGTFVQGKRQGTWKVYNQSGGIEKIVTFEDDIEKSELILNHKPADLNFFSVSQSIGNY